MIEHRRMVKPTSILDFSRMVGFSGPFSSSKLNRSSLVAAYFNDLAKLAVQGDRPGDRPGDLIGVKIGAGLQSPSAGRHNKESA
jgi:hypothetical protein